jgi:hypothetical protein
VDIAASSVTVNGLAVADFRGRVKSGIRILGFCLVFGLRSVLRRGEPGLVIGRPIFGIVNTVNAFILEVNERQISSRAMDEIHCNRRPMIDKSAIQNATNKGLENSQRGGTVRNTSKNGPPPSGQSPVSGHLLLNGQSCHEHQLMQPRPTCDQPQPRPDQEVKPAATGTSKAAIKWKKQIKLRKSLLVNERYGKFKELIKLRNSFRGNEQQGNLRNRTKVGTVQN